MTDMLFSKRVNAVSDLVSTMTADPGERLGIATALCEIYRYDLVSNFGMVKTERAAKMEQEDAKSTTSAPPEE